MEYAVGAFLGAFFGFALGFKRGVDSYDARLRRDGCIFSPDEMRAKVAAMVAEERAVASADGRK